MTQPHARRARLWMIATAAILALAACSGSNEPKTDKPDKSAASATTTAAEVRSFEAFEISGHFNGSVVSTRGDRVLAVGSGDEGLGDTLTGMTLFTRDGKSLAEAKPEVGPCAYGLAGKDKPIVVTNEVALLDAEGTIESGTQNTIRFYDDTLTETKKIELPEYRGPALEAWHEETANGGCSIDSTSDGAWVVTYDANRWYLVNAETLEVKEYLPQYNSPEHDLPSRVFPLGSDIVTVASAKLLNQGGLEVVDPATQKVVASYPEYDSSSDDGAPEGSDKARLADLVIDDEKLVDPTLPAAVYAYASFGDTFNPVRFDLATGTITKIGPEGRGIAPRLDPIGENLFFVDKDTGLTTYSIDGQTKVWETPNVTDVCAANDKFIAVAANGQLALLDRATGTQVASNAEVASSGIIGGSACAPVNINGFGWGIDDDAVRGMGGAIVSYFGQDVS